MCYEKDDEWVDDVWEEDDGDGFSSLWNEVDNIDHEN